MKTEPHIRTTLGDRLDQPKKDEPRYFCASCDELAIWKGAIKIERENKMPVKYPLCEACLKDNDVEEKVLRKWGYIKPGEQVDRQELH